MHVAVLGATGAVGREILDQLGQSSLQVATLTCLASARSAGETLTALGREHVVQEVTASAFAGVDITLFSAGGGSSTVWAPVAVAAGAVVIDNSSAWRMHHDVPLVVPEVNRFALRQHKGIIANPNCSTIQMVLPLKALHDAVGIERVVVSTYQSASGAGQAGIDELWRGVGDAVSGRPVGNDVFARPLAMDVIPHIGDFQSDGYTTEEQKMLDETRKIMSLPSLEVSATCVRVPVPRVHLESVTVDLRAAISADDARVAFAKVPGLEVLDDPRSHGYPMARDAIGRRETFVGRVREDSCRPRTLHFWVVSDNLLKGAAWNAVQLAEALHEDGLVHSRT
ncbi:MAG: aspartate-semialdehyde dehydrogenase [Bradymonadia bacterium]|jgi:aspartate-semialdehyde dehydrogenase